MLSVKGKKVLHIDRNDHYGGFVYFRILAILRPNDLAVRLLQLTLKLLVQSSGYHELS